MQLTVGFNKSHLLLWERQEPDIKWTLNLWLYSTRTEEVPYNRCFAFTSTISTKLESIHKIHDASNHVIYNSAIKQSAQFCYIKLPCKMFLPFLCLRRYVSFSNILYISSCQIARAYFKFLMFYKSWAVFRQASKHNKFFSFMSDSK